jgi:hypothetical protein
MRLIFGPAKASYRQTLEHERGPTTAAMAMNEDRPGSVFPDEGIDRVDDIFEHRDRIPVVMAPRLVDEKHLPTHDPSREAWVGATQRDNLPFARMAFHAENLAPSCGTGICAAFDPFAVFRP